MTDQATDELRRHLNQVIEILQPYALSGGPLNKQNGRWPFFFWAAVTQKPAKIAPHYREENGRFFRADDSDIPFTRLPRGVRDGHFRHA